MTGSGLGAENEIAFKTKRLKGRVRRMGEDVFLANFVGYFVILCQCNKNGFYGFKSGS